MFHQYSIKTEDVWKQKSLKVLDLQGFVFFRVLSQKKTLPFGDVFCWVPGGTRTHDIQNHNLTL